LIDEEGLDPAQTLMIGDRKHDLIGARSKACRRWRWGMGLAAGKIEAEAPAFHFETLAEMHQAFQGLRGSSRAALQPMRSQGDSMVPGKVRCIFSACGSSAAMWQLRAALAPTFVSGQLFLWDLRAAAWHTPQNRAHEQGGRARLAQVTARNKRRSERSCAARAALALTGAAAW
jgi:hypothetical protein